MQADACAIRQAPTARRVLRWRVWSRVSGGHRRQIARCSRSGFRRAQTQTSVVTPKPAIRGHFKTGHRSSGRTTVVITQPDPAEQDFPRERPQGASVPFGGSERGRFVAEPVGMWESRQRFPSAGGRAENRFLVFRAFHGASFPRVLRIAQSATGAATGVIVADLVRQLRGPHLST